MNDKEYVGVVVWFDNKTGYGFIEREGEEDLFVHFSDIICEGFKTIKKDQKVVFGIGANKNGKPKAINVKPIFDN